MHAQESIMYERSQGQGPKKPEEALEELKKGLMFDWTHDRAINEHVTPEEVAADREQKRWLRSIVDDPGNAPLLEEYKTNREGAVAKINDLYAQRGPDFLPTPPEIEKPH